MPRNDSIPDDVYADLCEKVLENFPGVWFVTDPSGSVIVAASKGYHESLLCNGRMFKSKTTLPDGLILYWLVPLDLQPN